MEPQTEEERAVQEYVSTLSTLDSISKVEINTLTMAAEDNKEYAVQIAGCIENHLRTVPSKKKLPILYLIDSICKNFPQSIYVQMFTQNIVSNFCSVFEVSPEKIRERLHKLRVTWGTTKIFPQAKLQAIDERVHKMDPNWPVQHRITSKSKQPPQIQKQQSQKATKQQPVKQETSSQQNAKKMKTYHEINNQNQFQQLQPPVFQAHQPILPPLPIDPTHLMAQAHPMDAHLMQLSHPLEAPKLLPVLPLEAQHLLQPIPQLPQQQPQQVEFRQNSLPNGLDITLDSLYGGKQCSNCSLRFDDNNKYGIHLDWHYRQNHLKSNNMFARKKWFYPLNLWVKFREINDDEVQENNSSDSNNVNDLLISHNEYEVPYAPASIEDEKNICPICNETFEKFWAEEEEEWRLRNASLHDDGRVYHPLCLIDKLQASVVE